MGFALTSPCRLPARCPRCGKTTKRLQQHAGSMVCREEALRQLKARTEMTPIWHDTRQLFERCGIGVVYTQLKASEKKKVPHGPAWAVEAEARLRSMGSDRIVYLLSKGREDPELLAELAMHALSGK